MLNYSLKTSDYTCKNALLYGNFNKHCELAKTGNLKDRFVHGLILMALVLPIIGQIAALFEMLISKSLKDRKIVQLDKKPYQRETLKPLQASESNKPYRLEKAPTLIQYFAKGATHYPYNSEGVNDIGWGCAWRAIQTSLTAFDLHVPFENLFHHFGLKENLIQIYRDKYPKETLANNKKFAPYDLNNGWAEPFIGEMAMQYYKIPAKLETVNGIPDNANAPTQVFHNDPLSFAHFSTRLVEHFKKEKSAPIVMDDGYRALNIVGVGKQGSTTTLWIADPHINGAVNHKKPVGLYTVSLDISGKQTSCSLNGQDKDQNPSLYMSGWHPNLQFEKKKWMALFPG